jgi:hypothetical protein
MGLIERAQLPVLFKNINIDPGITIFIGTAVLGLYETWTCSEAIDVFVPGI